jgi:hypothetical protein
VQKISVLSTIQKIKFMKIRNVQLTVLLLLVTIIFGSAGLLNSGQPPIGHTGATTGTNCTACHGGNPLNASGGSVVINGLPANYTPGIQYSFSVTVTHGVANRLRWGFSVKATGTNNNDAGTFSTVAPTNAATNGTELSHSVAPSTAASSSFTFNNLRWTAPSNPGAQEQTVTFYVAGNAADANDDNSGDFIYTATRSITLTPTSVNEVIPGVQQWKLINAPGSQGIIVQYKLTAATTISFSLYDAGGKLLQASPQQKLPAGDYRQNIATEKLSWGIYIVEMSTGKSRASQKVFVH